MRLAMSSEHYLNLPLEWIAESSENLLGVEKPNDLIEVAKVLGAWGLKGDCAVQTYQRDGGVLFGVKKAWLSVLPRLFHRSTFSKEDWAQVYFKKPKAHSDRTLIHFDGIKTPEEAQLLKGARLFISRKDFPTLDEGEYYWTDLEKLSVRDLNGQLVGKVVSVSDFGAHPVLQIELLGADQPKKDQTILVPFVARHVPEVNLNQRFLVIDWVFDFV